MIVVIIVTIINMVESLILLTVSNLSRRFARHDANAMCTLKLKMQK